MPSNHTIDLSQFKLVESIDTQEESMRKELSQSRLRSLLHYDPSTGVFTWKVAPTKSVKPGSVAGSKHGDGYIQMKVATKSCMAHRLAWFYIYGVWPREQIDHINGDRADNRLCNLREATNAENSQNIKARTNNTTGYLGVTLYKSKYKAQIKVEGTNVHLGYYATPEQAHQAYLAAKAKLHKFQPTPRA